MSVSAGETDSPWRTLKAGTLAIAALLD